MSQYYFLCKLDGVGVFMALSRIFLILCIFCIIWTY